MTNSMNKAHHIGIVVHDIQASEAWYVEHLGFERFYTYGWPGVKVAFIGREDLKIELFQNEQATPMDAERQAARNIALLSREIKAQGFEGQSSTFRAWLRHRFGSPKVGMMNPPAKRSTTIGHQRIAWLMLKLTPLRMAI